MKLEKEIRSNRSAKGRETMKTYIERVTQKAGHRCRETAGQGLTEYSILLALVAVIVIPIGALLGSTVKQAFCEPLITLNPEFTTSCIKEPPSPSNENVAYPITALAAYSSNRGQLYIAARISEDTTAALSVDGYGPMQYLPQKDVFLLVIQTQDPPETVTIRSTEGTEKTIRVFGS
jgi:Flp pilus assembly pilin Flp